MPAFLRFQSFYKFYQVQEVNVCFLIIASDAEVAVVTCLAVAGEEHQTTTAPRALLPVRGHPTRHRRPCVLT